jgi:hypothetical protein
MLPLDNKNPNGSRQRLLLAGAWTVRPRTPACNSTGPVFPGVRLTLVSLPARLPLAVASPSSRSRCKAPVTSRSVSVVCLPACLSTPRNLTSLHLTLYHTAAAFSALTAPPLDILSPTRQYQYIHTRKSSAQSSPKKRWQGSTCALLSCPTTRVQSRDRPSSFLQYSTRPATPHNQQWLRVVAMSSACTTASARRSARAASVLSSRGQTCSTTPKSPSSSSLGRVMHLS